MTENSLPNQTVSKTWEKTFLDMQGLEKITSPLESYWEWSSK